VAIVVKPLLTPADAERMIRTGELREDGAWELVLTPRTKATPS